MITSALSSRFVMGGLRFFAASFLLGLPLLLLAPLDIIRAFCALALACSAAGFALHLAVLREIDPGAVAAWRVRLVAALHRARSSAGRMLSAGKAEVGQTHKAAPARDPRDLAR